MVLSKNDRLGLGLQLISTAIIATYYFPNYSYIFQEQLHGVVENNSLNINEGINYVN